AGESTGLFVDVRVVHPDAPGLDFPGRSLHDALPIAGTASRRSRSRARRSRAARRSSACSVRVIVTGFYGVADRLPAIPGPPCIRPGCVTGRNGRRRPYPDQVIEADGVPTARSTAAVVFDLGGVLLDWDPRYLYRRLLPDEPAVEWFLSEICTPEWNREQDRGRPWAEAVAELSA